MKEAVAQVVSLGAFPRFYYPHRLLMKKQAAGQALSSVIGAWT